MPMRTNDGQDSHLLIKCPGYPSCAGLGREQAIWMYQHNSDSTSSLSIDETRCRSGTAIWPPA